MLVVQDVVCCMLQFCGTLTVDVVDIVDVVDGGKCM
jgi:hypothetical protein